MARIIGISGSLRAKSFNTALLRSASALAPSGTTLEIAAISGVPLYDGDVERDRGVPAAVTELKDRIAAADGLLIATPEYNNAIPGVLKNTIDWLSRPAKDVARVFGDRPVVLMGASGGPGGTRLAQAAWLPVFRMLGARLWSGKVLYVANASQVFDEEGTLVDEKTKKALEELVARFAAFASTKG